MDLNLDVSKNKLYNLPPGFEYLTNLKTLNFEANNIESLPKGIGRMVELKSLNLAKNRIVDFPDTICDLRSLRVLNMEKNKLLNVPLRIGKLNVIELRIGHNRIESLPEDMFDSSLGKSIKLFSCCENNLMELPSSLSLIDSDGLVDADYNPLVSPPPELLSEGLKVLQNYFRVRQNRKVQIEELLTDEDFEYVPSSAFPVAHEVLEDGTGFLTPGDLAEFDQAIHEYLNGEFYRCPASGEEIVANVNQLRELREVEMYLLILYTFLGIVKQLVTNKDKRFNDANIFEAKRSWGRKGEECNVWCISLNCLLRSTAPNKFHKDGRPSIFSMIKTALPPMVFPFTVDLLKDAIRLYVSPYGQIADTEEITFPHCDCVDEKRGKPKRHDPCVKAAVVIAKSIYVDEEANRREVEEDECLIRFEEIEEDIRIWLGTEEGIGTRETECKRRKALLKEDIKLRDELILSQKLKIKKCEETIKRFMKRKESFDAGEPYENHGYHTVSEPMKAIAAEEAELAKLTERTDLLLSVVAKMKEEYSMDMEVFRRNAANDLVQKYCVENYINFVDNNRRFAARNGLNRYWDGDDGEDFEKWKTAHKHVSVRPSTPGQIVKSRKTPPPIFEEPVQETEEERAAKALEPEYNWEGTHDMKKYKLNIYTRYKAERNISAALLEVLQK